MLSRAPDALQELKRRAVGGHAAAVGKGANAADDKKKQRKKERKEKRKAKREAAAATGTPAQPEGE